MILNDEIVRWIEYSICEKGIDVFPKSKSVSGTYQAFSERLRLSILNNNLTKREANMLHSIMVNANRLYCLPMEDISVVCANFYVERKWKRYMKVIALQKHVRYKLPDRRFPKF